MRLILFVLIFLIFYMPIVPCSGATTQEVDSLATVIWENSFGDQDYSYLNRVTSFSSADNALFVAGTYLSSAKGRSQKNVEGVWIWKIDESGNKLADIRLKNTDQNKFSDIEGMAIAGKSIMLFLKQEQGQTQFVKVSEKGEILISKKIGEGKHLSKVLLTRDNNFLLLGRQMGDALIEKIDGNGDVLWTKVYDRGKDDLFVDGLVLENGNFMLIENSGKIGQLFMTDCDNWLTKFDANGARLIEKKITGRYGNIALLADIGYLIIYDKSSLAGQDIWLKAVDNKLADLWDTSIAATKFGLEKFRILNVNRDFAAAGAINLRPSIYYVDTAGHIKWHFLNMSMDPAVGIDFLSNSNSIFIVSSLVTLDAQFKASNKIKIIKYQL